MNPDSTQDLNAVSLYETASNSTIDYHRLDGTGHTAALKITSHAANLAIAAGTIIGGSENCVDVNNEVRMLHVDVGEYIARGKHAISAKTSFGCVFTGHIKGRAKRWEVNLGSWSDQSDSLQDGTRLELTAEHYPIRVWLGNATIPAMDNASKYKLMGFGRHGAFVRKLVMFLWDLGKRLNIPGV
jgi:hypothetical protein